MESDAKVMKAADNTAIGHELMRLRKSLWMATVIAQSTNGATTNLSGLPPQPVLAGTATARNIQMGNAADKRRNVARLNFGVCIKSILEQHYRNRTNCR